MNISSIKNISFFILLALGYCVMAQSNFESLNESSIALNYKHSETYHLNVSIQSRAYIFQDDQFTYQQRQFDLTHFSTFSLAYNKSVSLGIRYRNRDLFDDNSNELRFTQQFNYTMRREPARFGHRFRLEQRIFDDFTVHRLRYRYAIDFPLNGLKVDVREPYFIGAMEALFSIGSTTRPEWDHRTTVQIGWLLTKSFKLQFGLEYRFEALNIKTEHKLFSLVSGIFII
ncbi:MAG: DUF2490 domain-containing protein [Bacteroidota bacterium]